MLHAPQGLHAFFRAYYHYKSADWKGNKPHPLKARTAEEMAQIPTYYVMERDKGMAATVAPFMPSAAEIAAMQVADRGRGRRVRHRIRPDPIHRRASGLSGAARLGPKEHCRDAHVLGPHHRRAVHVHRRARATGASTRPRAPSRACRRPRARAWWAFIWSTAPAIGCSRSSRRK